MSFSQNGRLRAVILDFGGVLYRMPSPGWLPLIHRLLRFFGLAGQNDPGLLEMMRASPTESKLVMDVMTGRIPEQNVWAEAAREWRISPERLARIRKDAYKPERLNRSLLDSVVRLRPRFKTALLTNAGSQFRETFVRLYNLEPHFDQLIISAEEGLAKPDPLIYNLAAERLDVEPEEALFIDDLEENVAGAQAAGMQAVLFTSLPEIESLLRSLLKHSGGSLKPPA